MSKKNTNASEPVVSGGVAPARSRKHAPAKRTTTPDVAPSSSIISTAAPNTQTISSIHVVTFDDIAKLAYSYWEARGCQGGNPEEDWLRAEQELNSKLVSAAQA
jgi:Protein of unknown function (DUF2934)